MDQVFVFSKLKVLALGLQTFYRTITLSLTAAANSLVEQITRVNVNTSIHIL